MKKKIAPAAAAMIAATILTTIAAVRKNATAIAETTKNKPLPAFKKPTFKGWLFKIP